MDRYASIPQSASLPAPFTQGNLVIGITGGSGCGKTTLLNLIRDRGGLVLDCDAIYHRLLKEDAALVNAISARFPGTVEDDILNRKKLGAIVFSDEQALADLNRITHTAVRQEVLRQLEAKPALAAIDAIGLFEGELAPLCHVTVASWPGTASPRNMPAAASPRSTAKAGSGKNAAAPCATTAH